MLMSDNNLLLIRRILQFAPFVERPARPARGTRKALTEIRPHLFKLLQLLFTRFEVVNVLRYKNDLLRNLVRE